MKQRNSDNKYVIKHDAWDKKFYNQALKDVVDLALAERSLEAFAPRVGGIAAADMFFSLFRAHPELKDPKDIRPSFMVNRSIMEATQQLKEFDELNYGSLSDPIGAALAVSAMEPKLQTLYDKLKSEQSEANAIAMLEGSIEQLQEVLEDENIDATSQAAAEEELEKLTKELEEASKNLNRQLDLRAPDIRQGMKEALEAANIEQSSMENFGQMWDMDRSAFMKMDGSKRLQLASRLRKNSKFIHVAQLLGAMQRLAFSEQARKTKSVVDEVYEIRTGDDINKLLSSELAQLMDPDFELEWFRRYSEKSLFQYELKGQEKKTQGGVIVCEDGSGSMIGGPEIWAKAFSGALMSIAKKQGRPFKAIHFGGVNEFKRFDFYTDTFEDRVDVILDDVTETYDGFEGVLEFIECALASSGTSFMTPLNEALRILEEEYERDGATNGDIVFITDGWCDVDSKWMKHFHSRQEVLGFKVFGIILGQGRESEPLNTICHGNVYTIHDFTSGDQIADVFRSV